MGSPLGCTFANYYMSHIENDVLSTTVNKPALYAPFVDDIIIVVNDEKHLSDLKEKMERKSVLKFTYEIGYNNLAFLDVNVKIHNERFQTSVHTTPTNSGNLLNYLSECPDKYKTGVITTLLHRARKICSDNTLFLCEVDRIKQLFINNNYPMSVINDCVKIY